MKVTIINQDPIIVSPHDAKQLMQSIASGAEIVIVNGEMVKSSAIMGIRNDRTGESLPPALWGALPAGAMQNFYDERREPTGDGYKKFQELKSRLLSR